MKLYMVTGNSHKIEEIRTIMGSDHSLSVITEIVDEINVEENGETFVENALKKVEAYRELGIPLIADDSGLEIDALDKFPGVHSARFMDGVPYKDKMEALIEKLATKENRSARFKCAAVFYDPENEVFISAEDTIEGKIAFDIRGTGGFGYDPIFIPEGYDKTFGELGTEIKNNFSHRGRAFKKLFSLISLYNEKQ